MQEEDKIQDAEIESSESPVEEAEKSGQSDENADKKKKDFYVELALFLILGILIGIAAKTEAGKRITIGFNDYQLINSRNRYDINELQKNLAEKKSAPAESPSENGDQDNLQGGTCGQ